MIVSHLRKLQRRPLNIICMPTHERYESMLAKTGHNFYSVQFDGLRQWNIESATPPNNYKIVRAFQNGEQVNVDLPSLKWDYVLSQEKTQQFPKAHALAQHVQVPLISLEHTAPLPDWDDNRLKMWQDRRGHKNVFITKWSKDAWKMEGDVINHGVDTDYFSPSNTDKQNVVLSVVQNWRERDVFCGYSLWERAAVDLPVRVVGKNPGLSKPARNLDELKNIYQSSAVFLNTSLVSPVPTALLEAMSCGLAIVTTSTCDIPNIIVDGENGILANTPEEIEEACKDLLTNVEKRKRLGDAARQTILEKYNEQRFIKEWNDVFYK